MKKKAKKTKTSPEILKSTRILSCVASATATVVTPPPPMPPQKIITVTANFTSPPGLLIGCGATMPTAPTVVLLSDSSGTMSPTGVQGSMTLIAVNQYQYTFPPQPDGCNYSGAVYGTWMVSGSIPDNAQTAPV